MKDMRLNLKIDSHTKSRLEEYKRRTGHSYSRIARDGFDKAMRGDEEVALYNQIIEKLKEQVDLLKKTLEIEKEHGAKWEHMAQSAIEAAQKMSAAAEKWEGIANSLQQNTRPAFR